MTLFFSSIASKIIARHELLLEALGHVFPEEEYSYNLVLKLSWILPTVVPCGGLIDVIFVGVYMKFGHPWKDIISKEKMPKSEFFVSLDSIQVPKHSLDSVDTVTENEETSL